VDTTLPRLTKKKFSSGCHLLPAAVSRDPRHSRYTRKTMALQDLAATGRPLALGRLHLQVHDVLSSTGQQAGQLDSQAGSSSGAHSLL